MKTNGNPPRGFVVYSGPSSIDGAPIVCIVLTGRSSNRKTGGMVQTYILRADVDPITAVRTGADRAICGTCIHRGNGEDGTGRSCYVTLFQGPRSVYDAFKRGVYPRATPERAARAIAGRAVRCGTYGDPAAVPIRVWRALLTGAARWTGYTHAWRRAHARGFSAFLMASADSIEDARDAWARGWRTFRVSAEVNPIAGSEVTCPASEEAGRVTTCERCGLCAGGASGARSVTIRAHGGAASNFTRRAAPVSAEV